MAGKISPSCKWNGMFPFRSVATKKVEQLRRLSVCSGKFPLETRVPFAFHPVEPEILAKWKAPQAYHEKVLKPVFGVSDYWYRYEFAKSRGQIHWHQLSWRDDRQPHQLSHEACEHGCDDEEYAARLNQWADENFAMTALHPAGSDEEGQPRKDLWPPPEGSADPISEDRDPLVKMLMEMAATQDTILEDHLLLVRRVGLHSCSDYFLRTPRHP